ncbi:MAG: MFS transporter [Candidatus Ancillula sp.]|jgi:GPH family glycoside/pentoside/hexuronide:cation symporter|nr:MFS transporter [Candidatus Ancillula sp.]
MSKSSVEGVTTSEDEKRGYYKIGWLERIAFGSGDMAQNFIYQTVTTYLLFFYTNVYGLNPAIAATMFLVVRIIDAVWDPVVGALIDRITLPFGKYRGWMALMGAPLAILMVLCFVVPPLAETGKVVYAAVTYVALSMVYTTINVPFGALNAALTRDPQETTVLTSVRMWLVNVAQVAITYGIPTIVLALSATHTNNRHSDKSAWLTTIIIYAVVGLIALFFSFAKTKERIVISKKDSANVKVTDLFAEVARNKHLRIVSFMFICAFGIMAITNSSAAYFVTYNMGDKSGSLIGAYNVISAIPALVILPFMPKLRALLGKRNLLFASIVVSVIGFIGLFFINPSYHLAIFIFQFIRSTGFGIVGAFIWSLIPEAIAYGEWLTGKRIAGIANALIGFFFKFGLALGGFVPGFVLQITGFSADATTQSSSALFGIRILLAGIPALLCGVLAFIVSRYTLTDEDLETYNSEIEARRQAAANENSEDSK